MDRLKLSKKGRTYQREILSQSKHTTIWRASPLYKIDTNICEHAQKVQSMKVNTTRADDKMNESRVLYFVELIKHIEFKLAALYSLYVNKLLKIFGLTEQ